MKTISITKQFDDIEVQSSDKRIFRAMGSADVYDREGERIPMEEFKKIMPTLMDRGGPIQHQHSNKNVGKILSYNFKTIQTPSGEREAVEIIGKIHNDYDVDDEVWEDIKNGRIEGLSVGGNIKKREKDGTLTGLEAFEFSVVGRPANQEAQMVTVNSLAKSVNDEELCYFAGKDADGERVYKALSSLEKDDDLSDACWDGYEAFGMKPAGDGSGRQVPDCRPVDKDRETRRSVNNKSKEGQTSIDMSQDGNDTQKQSDRSESESVSIEDFNQLAETVTKLADTLAKMEEDEEDEDDTDKMSGSEAVKRAEEALGPEVMAKLKAHFKGDYAEEDEEEDESATKEETQKELKGVEERLERIEKALNPQRTTTPVKGNSGDSANTEVQKQDGDEDDKPFNAYDIAKGKTRVNYQDLEKFQREKEDKGVMKAFQEAQKRAQENK